MLDDENTLAVTESREGRLCRLRSTYVSVEPFHLFRYRQHLVADLRLVRRGRKEKFIPYKEFIRPVLL